MREESQNYIRSTRLTDILEFRRIVRAVNMDITQLDAGAFHSDLAQLKVRDVLASLTTSNRRLRLQGDVRFLTISFAIHASGSAKWRGISVGPSDVLAVNSGEAFDLVVPPGVEAYCISVVGDAEVTLRNLGGPVLARKLSDTAHPIACDPDAVREMESWLVERFDGFGGDSDIEYVSAFQLERQFLRRLAACIRAETGSSRNGDATAAARIDAVRRVEKHLLDDLALPQTVDELCHVAGTSRRTIEYAFQDYFGTSPKRFLKALRLNAARNDLLRGDCGSAQVAEIATGWGFNHMGQFSTDYRHMFGERPSDTLRRSA
jgi:AraC family ethanolamine operon transcriptional activator